MGSGTGRRKMTQSFIRRWTEVEAGRGRTSRPEAVCIWENWDESSNRGADGEDDATEPQGQQEVKRTRAFGVSGREGKE